MIPDSLLHQYIKEAIGISIEIVSNEFNELKGNTHHQVIFQINEDEPDTLAFSVLFTLSLMSFTYSSARRNHNAVSEPYAIFKHYTRMRPSLWDFKVRVNDMTRSFGLSAGRRLKCKQIT